MGPGITPKDAPPRGSPTLPSPQGPDATKPARLNQPNSKAESDASGSSEGEAGAGGGPSRPTAARPADAQAKRSRGHPRRKSTWTGRPPPAFPPDGLQVQVGQGSSMKYALWTSAEELAKGNWGHTCFLITNQHYVPVQPRQEVTGVRLEKLGGRAVSKKWRTSVKLGQDFAGLPAGKPVDEVLRMYEQARQAANKRPVSRAPKRPRVQVQQQSSSSSSSDDGSSSDSDSHTSSHLPSPASSTGAPAADTRQPASRQEPNNRKGQGSAGQRGSGAVHAPPRAGRAIEPGAALGVQRGGSGKKVAQQHPKGPVAMLRLLLAANLASKEMFQGQDGFGTRMDHRVALLRARLGRQGQGQEEEEEDAPVGPRAGIDELITAAQVTLPLPLPSRKRSAPDDAQQVLEPGDHPSAASNAGGDAPAAVSPGKPGGVQLPDLELPEVACHSLHHVMGAVCMVLRVLGHARLGRQAWDQYHAFYRTSTEGQEALLSHYGELTQAWKAQDRAGVQHILCDRFRLPLHTA